MFHYSLKGAEDQIYGCSFKVGRHLMSPGKTKTLKKQTTSIPKYKYEQNLCRKIKIYQPMKITINTRLKTEGIGQENIFLNLHTLDFHCKKH